MRIDPTSEARRLLDQIDLLDLVGLADDPATVTEAIFGVTVTLRRPRRQGQGCAVDGTYDPGPPPSILVADDVAPARQRFTILHEFGHHMIEHDNRLNDLQIDSADRRDEEICNEIAASVLIPDETADQILSAGVPQANDVAALYDATRASRESCCVAATRRLSGPGCVILGTPDGTAVFAAHHPSTPWRIARGTPQGRGSLLVSAALRQSARARGVTRVQFASGTTSGDVHSDAFAADDGWVYQVVVADTHSPWQQGLSVGLTDTGPDAEEIECGRCDEASLVRAAPCRNCGDRTCPKCGYCSCRAGAAPRICHSCFLEKAPVEFAGTAVICIDCAQMVPHSGV